MRRLTGDRAWNHAARNALTLLGHTNPLSLVIAIGVLWLFAWAGDALKVIVNRQLGDPSGWLAQAAPLGFFIAVIAALWLIGRQVIAERPSIHQEAEPQQVRALILLLSAPTEPRDGVEAGLRALTGRLDDPELPLRVQGIARNWRMPLEAIRYHRPRLRKVVLVTSKGKGGSHAWAPLLIELIPRLATNPPVASPDGAAATPSPESPSAPLTVVTADDILGRAASADPGVLDGGIDFADANAVFDTVAEVARALRQQERSDGDILIDVTGGLKLTSILAAAVSLVAEGRCFQYVHITPGGACEVRSFDVTWQRAGNA